MDYIILDLVVAAFAGMIIATMVGVRKAAIIMAGYLTVQMQVKRVKLKQFRSEINMSTLIWAEVTVVGALLVMLSIKEFNVFEPSGVLRLVCFVAGLAVLVTSFIKVNVDVIEMVEACMTIEDDLELNDNIYRENTARLSRFDRQALLNFSNLKAFSSRLYKIIK